MTELGGRGRAVAKGDLRTIGVRGAVSWGPPRAASAVALFGALLLGACRGNAVAAAGQSMEPKGMRSVTMSQRTYTKPSAEELRRRLTPMQYEVTQNEATEPPFHNSYWDNHTAGLYVEISTGEPLFSSTDKFDSGTGWPSFTRPVEPGRVVEHQDRSFGSVRTEVRSKGGDAHLGHVFDDGPAPTGQRYCINSAAIRLVPVARLDAEGYGAYRALFDGGKKTAGTAAKMGEGAVDKSGR